MSILQEGSWVEWVLSHLPPPPLPTQWNIRVDVAFDEVEKTNCSWTKALMRRTMFSYGKLADVLRRRVINASDPNWRMTYRARSFGPRSVGRVRSLVSRPSIYVRNLSATCRYVGQFPRPRDRISARNYNAKISFRRRRRDSTEPIHRRYRYRR